MLLAQSIQALVYCALAITLVITKHSHSRERGRIGEYMNKKNINTTPATDNTAEAQQSAPATTPATAEKKKRTSNSAKAGKTTDKTVSKKTAGKSKKPATKKPAEKKNSKKAPAHSYNAEKNTFTLLVPSAKRDELGQLEAKLKEVSYIVPKTVKADQRKNFVDLIQAQMLDSVEADSNLKIAQINEKVKKSEAGEPTSKQTAKLDELKALKKLAQNTRTRLKLRNALHDDFAYLIACDVLNKPLNVELASVKVSLMQTSAELDKTLIDFMDGKTVTITADQQTILTECKTKIKNALERYTKETTWCDGFKLGISNKDVLMFYKLGFSGFKNRKPVYEYNEEKSKMLEKELAKYYLYKVDFTEQ